MRLLTYSLAKKSLRYLIPAVLVLLSPGTDFLPTASAQPPLPPPPALDRMVQRIALYPDPLLAQIMTAATYYDQIPPADMWANQHKYLHGDQLAGAIQGDQLPWDPSVQALLPFPNVLHMMASDPAWTQELGNAFLTSSAAVMDAVQRDRQLSYDYGYLRSNPYVSVVYSGPRLIVINPVNPALYYVPVYNPLIVYARPRPGFVVGGAITFGAGFAVGAAFAPWGWGATRFGWGEHAVFVGNRPWVRTYANRTTYVHPGYSQPHFEPNRRVETHRLEPHDEHHGPEHHPEHH
jgi:Protein of unknown function (DUF3300)